MRSIFSVLTLIFGVVAGGAQAYAMDAYSDGPHAPLLSLLPSAWNVEPYSFGFLVGESFLEMELAARKPQTIRYQWASPGPDQGLLSLAMQSNGEHDPLDVMGDYFDIDEIERPWSYTMTVHMLSMAGDTIGKVVPFASVAHEVDCLDVFERIGVGAGAQYRINRNATFNAEFLHFSDQSGYNSTLSRETRFLASIEIDF